MTPSALRALSPFSRGRLFVPLKRGTAAEGGRGAVCDHFVKITSAAK